MTKYLSPIDELLDIMVQLRDPDKGCPWDKKQTFESIAPYTIEEVYEVADAIDRRNYHDLCDELGDLLLQIIFQARIAEEAGLFAFNDVAQAICRKMRIRHPHVFSDEQVVSVEAQSKRWEEIKRCERSNQPIDDTSIMAGIARGIPEWQKALKLQKRAAQAGFVWTDINPIIDKLQEELEELRHEFTSGSNPAHLNDEIGDVLFVCVNLARHAQSDVSLALRKANAKFERRFRRMETLAAAQEQRLQDLSLAEQEKLWLHAKEEE